MSGPVHLVRRFLGSLSPRPLDPEDAYWARERLGPGERALWDRMSLADRKHAAGVAREVARHLVDPPRPVLAAALLHDVGKVESGLGTSTRVVATVLASFLGRDRVVRWTHRVGIAARLGRYLRHDVIGARMLEDAGADPLTVAWAREHHRGPEQWTVDPDFATALAAADDD